MSREGSRRIGRRAIALSLNMLEPLGSIVKTPAPLGIRTAAFAFDTFFSIFLPVNILVGTFADLARPSSAVRREARLGHSLCDVLLRDHRGRVGRVTRQGALWLAE